MLLGNEFTQLYFPFLQRSETPIVSFLGDIFIPVSVLLNKILQHMCWQQCWTFQLVIMARLCGEIIQGTFICINGCFMSLCNCLGWSMWNFFYDSWKCQDSYCVLEWCSMSCFVSFVGTWAVEWSHCLLAFPLWNRSHLGNLELIYVRCQAYTKRLKPCVHLIYSVYCCLSCCTLINLNHSL